MRKKRRCRLISLCFGGFIFLNMMRCCECLLMRVGWTPGVLRSWELY